MTHQLGLLLLLALLASNAIAMLYLQRTGALIHPLSRTLAVERLITAYHVAQGLSAEDASRLLSALQTPDSELWVSRDPIANTLDMRAEEHRLVADLRKRLTLPADTTIGMQLERISGGPAREHVFVAAGWAPLRLRTSIGLPDGSQLNAIQHPAGGYEWGRMLAYTLPVTTIPVLLIVVFFMRRIVQPVKTLAQATERVSRGEWIPPLPLSGPQEARDLTTAFNVMQERIARHVEGRTRMLAAISHDLNTPITELRLQIELLEDGAERNDMLESLDELRAMVRETLNFVRGDAVQEKTADISLTALLNDLARRYQSMGTPIGWSGSTDIHCRCRPLAVKRALTNLIDNALKHAGDASVSAWTEPNGDIRLEILDHGPGIEQAWLTQVFEPFVQLSQTGADHTQGGGLGLGLAIARACIQAHGGELTLENRPPAGLCAVVRLPAA
ncbi:HAMP domain-containing protein [Pseudomonas sp. CDFA 602]|uniref:ATP-binding protein n=1 Tax=Pseudomonas californiensis TaxID=2829823 RepID=UPI001E4950AC|nr:ATP-binding protein [Pseudomonas californiensis]MCD5997127.1 HAMP domain-containing protein [Pseudomonas californiensis]MCD6002729.1 HAMP domain-containing protein [Pseudomonas californiensis]